MPSALTAMTILAMATLGYIGLCAVSPFGPCRTCSGLGFQLHTRTTLTGRTQHRRGKDCRRCHGAGRRIRTGRRIHNAWTRTYRNGTR